MTVSLIGGHFTKNGIERNYPARVVLSINGNGLDEQHPDTIILFRDVTVYNDGPPDLHTHQLRRTIEYARWWYAERTDGPRLRDVWMANKGRAHYFTITNELGGSDPESIKDHVAFETNICQLAAADGLKCAVGKLAGDSPNWPSNLWEQLYVPFIVDMWNRYGAIYARHVYGGNLVDGNGNPTHDQPGNPSRPFDEVAHLRTLGYGGGMVLAECGLDGGYGVADYGRFQVQALGYAAALRPLADMVIGVCWWECGYTEQFKADYTNPLKQLKGALDTSLPKWTPASTPPIPPGGDYKSVVFVAAQEHTRPQYLEIAGMAFDEYGRTLTRSGDNALVMVGDGNDQSYGVIFDPDLPSQKAVIDLFEAAGLNYQTRYLSGNPLDGLRLGHLFAYKYQYTSRFNDARPYGNGKHEGVDCDLVGGATNNTAQVLCTHDGVIDRSLDSTGGYGKYVRVRHERNGQPFYTRYCHLDTRTAVTIGAAIAKGAPVGEVGTTGDVTGEHVHFNLEVPGFGLSGYVVADVVDPAPYLPTTAEMNALPPVPTTPPPGQTIDVLAYIRGTHRVQFDQGYSGGTQTSQVWHLDGNNWLYVKGENGEYEKLGLRQWQGQEWIFRFEDMSESPERFYAHYMSSGGAIGAPWFPRHAQVGVWYETPKFVQHYLKSNCARQNSGNVTDRLRLKAAPATKTYPESGQTVPNVITLEWASGEQYDFAGGNIAFRDATRNFWFMGWLQGRQDKVYRKPPCLNVGW